MIKIFIAISLALFLTACGSSDSTSTGNTQGNTSGVIRLTGIDTGSIGTTLNTGFVGSSVASDSQPDYIIIVDKNSKVTFTPPNTLTPNIADINNGFALIVTDESSGLGIKGISMRITANGTNFLYACSTPITVFIDCGINAITLNIANKTVSFNNAKVINTESDNVLTIDGTLTWTGNNIVNNNNDSSGGALTDITGAWKEDDPYLFISTLGNADEVYEIYKEDGSNLTFGYFMNEEPSCYDRSSAEYEDLGGGNISIDGDTPYNYVVSGNNMTVSFAGDSYTLSRSSMLESDFTPICLN